MRIPLQPVLFSGAATSYAGGYPAHEREDGTVTTLLPAPTESAEEGDAGPNCGCCIPPPGGAAQKDKALAELQARRDALDERLQGLSEGA